MAWPVELRYHVFEIALIGLLMALMLRIFLVSKSMGLLFTPFLALLRLFASYM